MLRSFFLSPVRCSFSSEDIFRSARVSPSLGCYALNQEILRDSDVHRTMLNSILRDVSSFFGLLISRVPTEETTHAKPRGEPTEKKGRTRRPATRAPRAPARAQTGLPRAHRRAHSACSGALTRRVSRRADQRVFRRATGTSCDVRSARLEARSRHASVACEVFAF